ncbi:hypothetical protein RCL1_002252 [Eukaryota sp. TZLM3-RCL]
MELNKILTIAICLLTIPMDSIIEQIRALHEEYDQHELKAVSELLDEALGPRDTLLHQWRVRKHLDSMHLLSQQILSLYLDSESLLLNELNHISGDGHGVDQALSNFYSDLNSMESWFAAHPDSWNFESSVIASSRETQQFDLSELPRFSGEEDFGKFLDLQSHHATFLNLSSYFSDIKTIEIDYMDYFDLFYSFKKSDGSYVVTKRDKIYENYLSNIYNYLIDFMSRTQPLSDISRLKEDLEIQFKPISLDSCEFYERSIEYLSRTQLKQIIINTRGYLENRAGRTLDELLLDLRDRVVDANDLENKIKTEGAADVAITSSEEVSESLVYNPKGLPLDFDGKPIPYWLYKLQGLSKKYVCEICGDVVYRGRKRFERHFNQPRHGHSLKCLKIPNTRHFKGVSQISDALRLYEKLKQERRDETFDPDEEEEVEDEMGNIMNRKTYLLVQKQFGE